MVTIEDATNDWTPNAFPLKNDEDYFKPEECVCDGLDALLCWECVKMGRKELPT